MRIGTNQFRGELPHLAPESLPDQGAQEATNCRLETGNLEAYRQFAQTKVLANVGAVQTIYLHRDKWLSWNAQVDVARNVILDDPAGLLLLTAPTIYSTPRYTTYALAVGGAEPYPVATLPLGVPAPTDIPVLTPGLDPTPTTFSIDVTDAGDKLATEWSTSTPRSGGTLSSVTQEAATGNPLPCYRLSYDEIHNAGEAPWARRNFGVENAARIQVTAQMRFSGDTSVKNGWVGVATSADGAGVLVGINGGFLQIRNSTALEWYGSGLVAQAAAAGLAGAIWYTLNVTVTVNPSPANTQTVTAEFLNGVTVIASVTATNVFTIGGNVFITAAIPDDSGSFYATDFDNIHVQATGSTGITPNLTATSYVYTFVNDQGWESAPSLATDDILRPDGVSITVVTSTTAPPGYSAVTLKRIYRVVTATTGDLFLLVAEIPLAQASYVDTKSDNQVGPDILESQEFDLPPATLECIISLPNGIYAGIFGKQLCLSAAGWPHAWPLRQRYPCESDLTAICNIDNTIVVGTETVVYTCTGTDPGSYVMSKPGERQACVSKRGMVYLDGQGVAFPSPDGYQVCAGSAGAVRNMTENVFTKLQWQALGPESFIAAVHDGVLHWYWSNSPTSGSYALDAKPGGFGLIRLSHHATATFVDPLSDALYLVMDANTEPTDVSLPVASTAVTPTGLKIFEFNAETGSGSMVFRWRGKLNLLPYPQTLRIGRVRAATYTNIIVNHYGNGVLLKTRVIANGGTFTVPARKSYDTYEIELIGTSTVRETVLVDDMREFG